MSDLDEQLKDIAKRIHTMGMSDQLIGVKKDYTSKQLDRFVTGIKAAFKEAGYVHIETPTETQLREWEEADRIIRGDLLTGAEWLERFEKELKTSGGTYTSPDYRKEDVKRLVDYFHEAAKRASGLSSSVVDDNDDMHPDPSPNAKERVTEL